MREIHVHFSCFLIPGNHIYVYVLEYGGCVGIVVEKVAMDYVQGFNVKTGEKMVLQNWLNGLRQNKITIMPN